MRLRIIQVAVVAAAVSLAACATQAPSQEFGKQDVEQVRQMIQSFVAAYNAKDVAKLGTFFSENAALMPPNRSTLRGIELVKGYYEGRWNDEGATNLAIEPIAIEGHGTIGFVAGTFSLDLKGPGGETQHDRGKVIWIIHKYAGQWKFEWQIMSSDLPPVEPPAAPAPKK
jgi:ketosteroid isomerase-like protein